jgi:GNAT superfamily N-acetyltransferase
MDAGIANVSSALFDDLIVYPAGPLDREAIEEFVARLSPGSRYLRFLHALRQIPAGLMNTLLRFEPPVRATMLAFRVDSPAELLGIAQYEATQRPGECEVAVVVADAWQRKGVAGFILRELARVARLGGFRTASADILSENHAAIALARQFDCTTALVAGSPQMTRVSVSLDRVLRSGAPAVRFPRAARGEFMAATRV